jgi:hypothetical protein
VGSNLQICEDPVLCLASMAHLCKIAGRTGSDQVGISMQLQAAAAAPCPVAATLLLGNLQTPGDIRCSCCVKDLSRQLAHWQLLRILSGIDGQLWQRSAAEKEQSSATHAVIVQARCCVHRCSLLLHCQCSQSNADTCIYCPLPAFPFCHLSALPGTK